ncbi:sigma-70 family RNA polymerase sigma factor [Streptomyces sp. NPDC002766]|uniref:RNA polymerase sigma factor n=1 Tax=Streptomyces sp. NPDC002766 TaxID=3154429 RepID=UPI00332FD306
MTPEKRTVGPVAPPEGGATGSEFETLYRANAKSALLYVRSKGVPEQDAPEIVAAAFASIWSRWQTAGAPEEPRPYLFAVLRHQTVNYWRECAQQARRIVDSVDETDFVQSGWDFTDSVELAAQLRDLLRRLPQRQAQVVVMRLVMGLPTHVIANQLGISKGAVRTHLAAAKKSLAHDMRPSISPRKAFE